jgi:hypothetical protein
MWGVPDGLGLQIWLDGSLTLVRQNLWHALNHLRCDKTTDRVLWIDALCINQEDEEERDRQVGFMGELYSNARTVLAWLGCPEQVNPAELLLLYVPDAAPTHLPFQPGPGEAENDLSHYWARG